MLDLLEAGLPSPARGVFTTRQGGVSAPPYAALNLATHVGDDERYVLANRRLVSSALGGRPVVYAQQVHGDHVALVTAPDRAAAGVTATDGLVTTTRGLALAVLGADCLPVLLAGEGVVGAAHVGRGGLLARILSAVIAVMREHTGGQLVASIGPGICGACYEVSEELAADAERLVPGAACTTLHGAPGIDLFAGAAAQLAAEGVATGEWVGGCTLGQPARFYSHRRDGVTGRHGGLVWLE